MMRALTNVYALADAKLMQSSEQVNDIEYWSEENLTGNAWQKAVPHALSFPFCICLVSIPYPFHIRSVPVLLVFHP